MKFEYEYWRHPPFEIRWSPTPNNLNEEHKYLIILTYHHTAFTVLLLSINFFRQSFLVFYEIQTPVNFHGYQAATAHA
jgi:hypothetical protein